MFTYLDYHFTIIYDYTEELKDQKLAISTDGLVRYRTGIALNIFLFGIIRPEFMNYRNPGWIKSFPIRKDIFTSTGNHESNHQQLTVICQYSILYGTSIRYIMGRLFFEPIIGHSVSSQNGCEDDRLSICPFTRLFSIVFAIYLCSYYF